MSLSRGLVILLCLSLAACADSPHDPARSKSKVALQDCRLEGLGPVARCGTLDVPENPAAPQGKRITLSFAVLPALSERPKPDAVLVLAGGPGQAAKRLAGLTLSFLSPLRRERDLVFLDQRGTGDSNRLQCDFEEGRDALEQISAPDFPEAAIKKCLADLPGDPRFYTTTLAMRDVESLRLALGYAQFNLWGGSYGTRAALEYLRLYPERVRSLVLDGVAPTAIRLPLFFPRDGEAALLATFADCERDPACVKAFPRLREIYLETLASLGEDGRKLRVDHPRLGDAREVRVTRDAVQATLRAMLYLPETASLIPIALREAAAGRFGPLLTQAYVMHDRMQRELASGLYLSVVCSEDLPRISPSEAAEQARHSLMGTRVLDALGQACRQWPRGEVAPEYYSTPQFQVPALILSGSYDPATPPVWGELVAKQFPRSRELTVASGHGVSSRACVPEIIQRFVRDIKPEELDLACAAEIRRPHFFLRFAGTAP